MIPKDKITQRHVLDAISEIDRSGVPRGREARGFDLAYKGKLYPPKYVVSLAAKYAVGSELHPSEFSGGEPTNSLLRDLEFEIQPKARQSIRDGLQNVMETYATARAGGPFGREHEIWKQFIRLQQDLGALEPIRDNPHIKIDWSVGQGGWTKIPWIALMDDRETDSTQRGVYVVFLFRQDMTGVYLTLAQGVTEPKQRLGGREARRQFLNSTANEIRTHMVGLTTGGFNLDDNIQLNADAQLGRDYEDSVIAYKLYEKGSVPDDDTIEADLAAVTNAYQTYVEKRGAMQGASRYWLFQANPKFYNIVGALEALKEQTWLVSSYKNEIRKGDPVYVWEAGVNAGIVATGTIASDPAEMPMKEDEKPFGLNQGKFAGPQLRVLIHFDRVLRNRLTRHELMQDSVLKTLGVIKFANATNFKVTAPEAARIEELIDMHAGIETPRTSNAELQRRTFLSASQISELEELLSEKKQIIFEGPPGSGKTFVARLFARYFAGLPLTDEPDPRVRIVQFHQSYSYEDFIEGIRPQSSGGEVEYKVVPGIFKRLCSDAQSHPEKKFVLIVDEINRGNISRVFGELLLLLEYRNLGVALPYQKDSQLFSIPSNVFLIGTMNTTDRSLAQIDYALRRRFYFYRLMPVVAGAAPVLQGWLSTQQSFTSAEREEVLTLFLNLNARIHRELGEHFQIGHSYFMKPGIRSSVGRKQVWDYAVLPLLEEYFYNRRNRDSLLAEFNIEKLLALKAPAADA